jgi:hypothetical protein
MQDFLRSDCFQLFQQGHLPLLCVDNILSDEEINLWKDDALALQAAGFGVSAGVASRTANIRQGVHQIWLQSPGSSSASVLHSYVGDIDARKSLFRKIDALRGVLDYHGVKPLPHDHVELSYLLYDENGASYAKHVDCSTDKAPQSTRHVSFLLYLGGVKDEPWDHVRHGGCLRIHGQHSSLVANSAVTVQPGLWADLAPTPGRMVCLILLLCGMR